MGDGNGGWASADSAIIGLMAFFVVVLLVVGAVLLVHGLTRRNLVRPSQRSATLYGAGEKAAVKLLEERYARGEIDREEFLQRRQDLLGD